MAGPRAHHYLFAHRLLRDLAFQNGERVLEILSGPDAATFLERAWQKAGESLDEGERLPGEGLEPLTATVTGPLGVAVVRLPRPKQTAEAHFVAIVRGPGEQVHYYTLERSIGPDGRLGTMLCGWAPDGRGDYRHVNLGPGPKADERAFLKAVQEAVGRAR